MEMYEPPPRRCLIKVDFVRGKIPTFPIITLMSTVSKSAHLSVYSKKNKIFSELEKFLSFQLQFLVNIVSGNRTFLLTDQFQIKNIQMFLKAAQDSNLVIQPLSESASRGKTGHKQEDSCVRLTVAPQNKVSLSSYT